MASREGIWPQGELKVTTTDLCCQSVDVLGKVMLVVRGGTVAGLILT